MANLEILLSSLFEHSNVLFSLEPVAQSEVHLSLVAIRFTETSHVLAESLALVCVNFIEMFLTEGCTLFHLLIHHVESKVVKGSKLTIAAARVVMLLHIVVCNHIMPVPIMLFLGHPTVGMRIVHLIFLEERFSMVPAVEAMVKIHLLMVYFSMLFLQFVTVVYGVHYLAVWDRLVSRCRCHHVPNFTILGASRIFSLNLRCSEREQQDL